MTAAIDCLFEAFGDVEKPGQVRGCDCPFCISAEGIVRLLDADRRTLTCDDLIPYVANVLGTVGGPMDFAYLLPAILKVWAEEMRGYQSAFNERLHPALLKDGFLHGYLPESRREAVVAFMREALLDRIGCETSLSILPWGSPCCPCPETMGRLTAQCDEVVRLATLAVENPKDHAATMEGLRAQQLEAVRRAEAELKASEVESGPAPATYGWFRHFASYGVIAPDIENLWTRWWSMPNEGCAIAAIQYASCLICDDQDNPVFPPRTGGMGGGAPQLWSYESFGSDECWRAENVKFLAGTLSVPYLKDKLAEARNRFSDPQRRSRAADLARILEHETHRAGQRIPRLMELLSAPQDVLATW